MLDNSLRLYCTTSRQAIEDVFGIAPTGGRVFRSQDHNDGRAIVDTRFHDDASARLIDKTCF